MWIRKRGGMDANTRTPSNDGQWRWTDRDVDTGHGQLDKDICTQKRNTLKELYDRLVKELSKKYIHKYIILLFERNREGVTAAYKSIQ